MHAMKNSIVCFYVLKKFKMCCLGSAGPGIPCPRGHYCGQETGPLGSANPPTACEAGTYTAEEGARCKYLAVVYVQYACG